MLIIENGRSHGNSRKGTENQAFYLSVRDEIKPSDIKLTELVISEQVTEDI